MEAVSPRKPGVLVYFSRVFLYDLDAVACPSTDRAFICFCQGGALDNFLGVFMSRWLRSGGSFRGFPLAAGCQGRQEEEGGWFTAVTCSPAVGPLQGLAHLKVGDPGG